MTPRTSLIAVWYSSEFLQFAFACLLGLEQPRVLYGDRRLVGEGFEQLDLSIGKRTNLRATDGNHADGLTRTDQRDGQYGAVANAPGTVAALRVFSSFGLYIGNLNRSPIEDGTSGDNLTPQGQRIILRDRPMVGDAAEKIAVHQEDRRVISVAKAGSARRYVGEHALEVRRRTRNRR